MLYACDFAWWKEYQAPRDGGLSWTKFDGLKVTQDARVAFPDVLRVPGDCSPGLCLDPARIHTGGTSGYQAINLAFHLGVRDLALLGYDYQHTGGKVHFFGDHPEGMNNFQNPASWSPQFDRLAADCVKAGMNITNCTRETALECFQREPIARWLQRVSATPSTRNT